MKNLNCEVLELDIEEAIKYIKNDIEIDKDTASWFEKGNKTKEQIEESINAYETLLTAYEKEKETNKQIKSKLDEKNIPIETLLAEFERLEDLEDDLTTVYLNGVYDGEKKVQDKIKAKIEEVSNGTYDAKIVLQSLLEKE